MFSIFFYCKGTPDEIIIIKFVIFWKSEGHSLQSFGTREKETLAMCTPYELHVKLFQFHQRRFYFTISHWSQRHFGYLCQELCMR